MTSGIDATVPVSGTPTTASVRANFAIAAAEITALQQQTAGAPFLPIAGGTMGGALYLDRDPTDPRQVATKAYVDLHSGGGGGGTSGVPEAPADGVMYGRQNGGWFRAATPADITAAINVAASETVSGILKIATTALVTAGADNTTAVSPAKLQAKLAPYVRTDATSIGYTAANVVNYMPATGGMQFYIQTVAAGQSASLYINRADNAGQAAIYGMMGGGEQWRIVLGDITTNNFLIRRASGGSGGNSLTIDVPNNAIAFNPAPGQGPSGTGITVDQPGIGPSILTGPITPTGPATDYFLIAARRLTSGTYLRDGGLVIMRGPTASTNPGGVELSAGTAAGGYKTLTLAASGALTVPVIAAPPAGAMGEVMSLNNTAGLDLVSGTAVDVASLTLTAGTWLVSGSVQFQPAPATTQTNIRAWINTATASEPFVGTPGLPEVLLQGSFGVGSNQQLSVGSARVAVASGTTVVYLGARSAFAGGAGVSVFGWIMAFRIH